MIEKLEYFIALAREKHFGRASEICLVTQPTLSAGIRQLESQLGVMLVKRGSRFQGLTQEGEQVLTWARRIVGEGGPLGAYFPRALFDTPFDYEAFAARDGLIGHAGIVVFDDSADMLKQARFAFAFCTIESCGRCTPCRVGSLRGTETLDKLARGVDPDRQIALVTDLCNIMKFGSLCALGGFTPYPVMSALRHFPEDFKPTPVAAAAE